MDKQVKRGYNEYIRLDEGIGKDAMMDVALLVMEDGDTWSCEEPEKEVAALVFDGKCTIKWENESYDVDRPNPFDYNPSCLHVCKGVKFEIIAHGPCNIYIQKTLNEKTFPSKMYKPEDTDTWARGNKGELMGCIKRDVRTCFDLDNAPYSNMVLGEVVNLPGKWSSYPPHHHPQPECYFYRFDKPMGFGAGWGNGEIYETHHNGLAIITDKMHSQVTAPGYSCCYAWGIRHLPGNPWDKTRIDDEEHLWLLEDERQLIAAYRGDSVSPIYAKNSVETFGDTPLTFARQRWLRRHGAGSGIKVRRSWTLIRNCICRVRAAGTRPVSCVWEPMVPLPLLLWSGGIATFIKYLWEDFQHDSYGNRSSDCVSGTRSLPREPVYQLH